MVLGVVTSTDRSWDCGREKVLTCGCVGVNRGGRPHWRSSSSLLFSRSHRLSSTQPADRLEVLVLLKRPAVAAPEAKGNSIVPFGPRQPCPGSFPALSAGWSAIPLRGHSR